MTIPTTKTALNTYNRLAIFAKILILPLVNGLPKRFLWAVTIAVVLMSSNVDAQYGHSNNWTFTQPLSSDFQFEKVWTETVGYGRSQIIADDRRLFVAAGEDQKRKNKPSLIRSRLLCLDRESGDLIWKHESEPREMYDAQESFSGAPISPQATPLLIDDSIITITFTGQLECLNRKTGTPRWNVDLVEDLHADPVQFGFSASPIAIPGLADRIFVMAAGAKGGLYCLSINDGSTIWRASCESQSYATPTLANLGGTQQLITVTKDDVIGIDLKDGKQLWSHELAEKGLTNVPSPIVLPDGIIISGQGCKGTRRIVVSFLEGRWSTVEKWYSKKVQFFYSNWLLADSNIAIGCDGNLLVAFDINDGSLVGRWRGFNDSNILKIDDVAIVVDGRGNLNVLRPQTKNATEPHWLHCQKISLLNKRCWTPATVVDDRLLVRGADQLMMVRFSKQLNQPLTNKLKKPKVLSIKRTTATSQQDVDHVQAIFETYEQNGLDAAMKLYSDLRAQTPCPLVAQDRVDLFNAAKQQGLNNLAKMILAHALQDFPESDEIREIAKGSK